MADERKFIRENTNRLILKEFLIEQIKGAGFGGMDIQRTPMGTRIVIEVERPGLVIGRGGRKVKELTDLITEKFGLENPQIEIQEAGTNAPLNAQIMAEKLASALERGWHFRRAGHSTLRRIMAAGAKGCQVIISGKLTGARHRTEKFIEGHVKYCGETVKEVMDTGYDVAKIPAGVIGVKVRIMKPDAKLPDEIEISLPEKEKTVVKKEKPAAAEKEKTEKPVKEKPVEAKKTDIKRLKEIPGIGPSSIKKLEAAGFKSLEEIYEADIDELSSIEGIGEKTAENIIKEIRKLLHGEK